jgi:WhiB family redox-sensing transcriptional regulator
MKQMENSWTENALCKGVHHIQFFSEEIREIKNAKIMCSQCQVASNCLVQAIKNQEIYGVWGGLSQRERRKYHRLYKEAINLDIAKEIVIKHGNKLIS